MQTQFLQDCRVLQAASITQWGLTQQNNRVKLQIKLPGTFQDGMSIHAMHFSCHYHTMLFCSSGLAMPPDKSKDPCPTLWIFKLFIASLLLLSQPHTTQLRVQFIWESYSSNSHHSWAGAQVNSLYTTQDFCLAAGIKTSQSRIFYM